MKYIKLSSDQIKKRMKKTGVTQSAIARRLDVKPMQVWRIVHKRGESPRVEREIARAIGWPIPGEVTNEIRNQK